MANCLPCISLLEYNTTHFQLAKSCDRQQNLRFSQQCCSRFKSSGMSSHVKLTLQGQCVDIPHDMNDHHAYPQPLGREVCVHASTCAHTHKTTLDIMVRGNGKFTQEHAMKDQIGSRGRDLLFL